MPVRAFLDRGGPWVAAQVVLLAAVVGAGRLGLLPMSVPGRRSVGWFLVVVAIMGGLAASNALGRNLTPYPTPVAAGTMVEHGLYRLVRHPIYTAVILGMIGVALLGGDWLGLAVAFGLVPFFGAKSRFEELHLLERYPGYAAYQQRVRTRIIPGIL